MHDIQASPAPLLRPVLHPFCQVCGWRKGGVDSWNGRACKCGHSDAAIPMIPASVAEHRAAIAAAGAA